ncbi:hypothetical protein P3S68_022354 [Capsicum galapagoense]
MFDGEPSRAQEKLAGTGQRGVCGAVWGNNDIAYRCRTCGGCCDCGDVTTWKREGFCSRHKGVVQIQPLPEEFANSMGPVLDLLLSGDIIEVLQAVKHCESLLSFISRRVSSSAGLLDILVRAEKFMISEENVKMSHELLLKLLAEPQFKYEFAKVFLSYYPTVVNEAVREGNDIVLNKYPLLSTFSVQIFMVPTLTLCLVKEMKLLPMLLGCLQDIFVPYAGEDGKLQV